MLTRLEELIVDDGALGEAAPWRVYCFGHSLGGALACLCALDVAALGERLARDVASVRARDRPADGGAPPPEVLSVTTYTYGCPRLGNHAFARHYSALIPDGWDLVHNNDVIARAGK